MERIVKDAFCVIGKAGSTNDGAGFVERLWNEANSNFNEVEPLAAKNEDGTLKGIWGAMTNFDFEFMPWENNFTEGMYLAGIEARVDAVAPKGWKKWIVPGFTYIKIKVEGKDTFSKGIAYLEENHIALAGAVQDFTDPQTGDNYMLFPVAGNDSKQGLIREIKAHTDQFSVCGLHCEYCFLAEWCGGCKSTCNTCAYATLSDDNICPNVSCSKEKGYAGCYECGEIRDCNIGFYGPDSDGANASKALAILRRDHGDKAVTTVLAKLHEKYSFLRLQEVLNEDLDMALEQLKNIMKEKIEAKKIIILGCSGSGKSTFARKLQAVMGLPLIHLDNVWWNADRSHITREEFDARLDQIIQGDEWIIDGDYSRTYEVRLQACEAVIFLDYSEEECMNGITERVGKDRSDMPWTENTLDPELVELVKNYHTDNRPKLYDLFQKYSDKQIIIFQSRPEAEEWIRNH